MKIGIANDHASVEMKQQVVEYLKEKGFKIVKKKKFKNPIPEHYPKVKFDKYKLEFDSRHYIAYFVKNSK